MRKPTLLTIVGAALLSGLAFVSCNKSLSPIPVESVQDKHFVDALSDSYTYLVLDDSSFDAVLGQITDVVIDDDLIFISHIPHAGGSFLTDQELSVFDKEGKFIRRIGHRGRAKNEYVYLTSWALDKKNKEVYMFDRTTNVIKKYSYLGEYISKIDLSDETSAARMFMIGDKVYLQTIMPYDKRDDLIEVSPEGTCKEVFDRREIGTSNFGFSGGQIKKTPDLKSFYHLRPMDNTLYHITDNGKIDSCGYFDFIEVPSQAKIRNLTNEDVDYLMTIPSVTYETNDYYIVVIANQPAYVLAKSTGKLMGYKPENAGHFVFNRKTAGINDDMIICSFSSEDAKHGLTLDNAPEDLKNMFRDMAASENESLIFYHIKK